MTSSPKYKPKLVVVLSRFPYPLEKGDKLRAYYQLADLSRSFEVYLFCTTDCAVSPSDMEQIRPFCLEINVFQLKKGQVFLNLLGAFITGKPFQVAYFYRRGISRKIQQRLEELKPDHIFCQLVRVAEYVKNYHACAKTIDLMDALSKGMERRAADAPFYLKWIFREEAERLKRYETKVLDYFEHASIISSQDKRYIIHPRNSSIQVIPNGVGERFFSYGEQAEKTTDLIFTGNMSYGPNVQASQFIGRELLPELKKVYPGIKADLVGATPSPAVQSLAGTDIRVTGWVDDMRPYYAQAEIFIAPMFSGSGMQNKILEAMAMGIPCITTRLANNAILAQDGEQIMLAETKAEMCAAVRQLKSDPELYARLSRNAKDFVASNYNWKAMNEKLIALMKGS
ncbi:MAG: glycosyltransferase [Bacteroidota bacterium]